MIFYEYINWEFLRIETRRVENVLETRRAQNVLESLGIIIVEIHSYEEQKEETTR